MASRKDLRAWTADEDARVCAMYATHSAMEIGRALGRTRSAVKNRAGKLGLRKSENAGQFRPGNPAWNKGSHYDPGGRGVETRFKAGHKPHTWKPIGHTRVRSDGYLERKCADTGCTRRDYVCIHALVWRMHGRSVPAGHVLVFRDGNRRNVDINNLEVVTRGELMRRNTIHNYPEEIARAVQLRGALIRQINKISKDNHP